MKLFLNKHLLTVDDIKLSANFGGQDIFLTVPFLSESLYYDTLLPILGRHNESLYTQLYYTGANFLHSVDSIQECDYCVIPFRFDVKDDRVYKICKEAKTYNKQVISFFTSDCSEQYDLPDNLILFRTSLYKKQKQKNVRVLPALHPDHLSNFNDNVKNSISFCGQLTSLRRNLIQKILNLNLNTDFIYRQGFWAPEITSKVKARKQYYANLYNNRYALCIRGEGNFSFRFYEALSFGRIPILIDTECELPFSNTINWSDYIITLNENNIDTLPSLLREDKRSMIDNRNLWLNYLSINGYAKNFIKDI